MLWKHTGKVKIDWGVGWSIAVLRKSAKLKYF